MLEGVGWSVCAEMGLGAIMRDFVVEGVWWLDVLLVRTGVSIYI